MLDFMFNFEPPSEDDTTPFSSAPFQFVPNEEPQSLVFEGFSSSTDDTSNPFACNPSTNSKANKGKRGKKKSPSKFVPPPPVVLAEQKKEKAHHPASIPVDGFDFFDKMPLNVVQRLLFFLDTAPLMIHEDALRFASCSKNLLSKCWDRGCFPSLKPQATVTYFIKLSDVERFKNILKIIGEPVNDPASIDQWLMDSIVKGKFPRARKLVEFLLKEKKANVDCKLIDTYDGLPIHRAARKGDVALIRLLAKV